MLIFETIPTWALWFSFCVWHQPVSRFVPCDRPSADICLHYSLKNMPPGVARLRDFLKSVSWQIFCTTWVTGERWHPVLGSVSWPNVCNLYPPRKLTFSQLKMDGWKISFLFWYGFLARYGFLASAMLVSESVYDSITSLTSNKWKKYWLDGWCTSWPSQRFLSHHWSRLPISFSPRITIHILWYYIYMYNEWNLYVFSI